MPPKVAGRDFPEVEIIIGKISLLLTYWAQCDLGISKEQFLSGMETQNRIYLRAMVDRVALARTTHSVPFYKVGAEEFERLNRRNELSFGACLMEGPAGEIEFSEEYTKHWRVRCMDPKCTDSFSEWLISVGLEQGSEKFQTTFFLESESKTREFGWVCIIDKSKLPLGSATAINAAQSAAHGNSRKRDRET